MKAEVGVFILEGIRNAPPADDWEPGFRIDIIVVSVPALR
jgi:hypothetical protein